MAAVELAKEFAYRRTMHCSHDEYGREPAYLVTLFSVVGARLGAVTEQPSRPA